MYSMRPMLKILLFTESYQFKIHNIYISWNIDIGRWSELNEVFVSNLVMNVRNTDNWVFQKVSFLIKQLIKLIEIFIILFSHCTVVPIYNQDANNTTCNLEKKIYCTHNLKDVICLNSTLTMFYKHLQHISKTQKIYLQCSIEEKETLSNQNRCSLPIYWHPFALKKITFSYQTLFLQ